MKKIISLSVVSCLVLLFGTYCAEAINLAPVAISRTVSVNKNMSTPITLTATDLEGAALSYSIVSTPTQGTLTGTIPEFTYTPPLNYSGTVSFLFKVNDGGNNSNVATITIHVINTINTFLTKPSDLLAPNSIYLTPIPSNAAVVSNSSNMINFYNEKYRSLGFATYPDGAYIRANTYDYSYPIYEVKTTDQVGVNYVNQSALQCTGYHGCYIEGQSYGSITNINIPLNAAADPGSDHHMVIIDWKQGKIFEFWNAVKQGSTWSSESGSVINIGSNGVKAKDQNIFCSRASCIPIVATTIRYSELIGDQPINHAIAISAPAILAKATAIWYPAGNSDGITADVNTFPEGARLQLNPNFNIDVEGANWPEEVRKIAHALQDYGAFVADGAGGVAIYLENLKVSAGTDWNTILGYDIRSAVTLIPWNQMRVLTEQMALAQLPPPPPANRAPVANNLNIATDQNILVNATLNATDPDGDILTYIIVSLPSNGVLTGVGAVGTYTPNAIFVGTDSFTYKVNDGKVDSNVATVNITVNPVNQVPNLPTNLVLTIGSRRVNLAWQDNSNDEVGFLIERKDSSGNYTQIMTLGANVTSFSNTGLSRFKTYFYRARAYNAFGNSNYSNEASIRAR